MYTIIRKKRMPFLCCALALLLVLALCPALAEDDSNGPPATLAIGIVIDAGDNALLPYLHSDPDDASNVTIILPLGTTVEVFDTVDDAWCHVHTAPYDGYVRKEHLTLYLAEDLFVTAPDAPYEAGTYAVGTDLPSGVYVFEIPQAGVHTLELTVSDVSRTWELTGGYGVFTFYLPEQSTLTLSDGSFSPLEDRGFDFSDHDARHSKTGRYMTYKNISAGYFNIQLVPGATSGYYEVSSLADAEDLTVEPRRVEVLPGIVYEDFLQEGMFIEYYNCYSPGNG